MKLSPA